MQIILPVFIGNLGLATAYLFNPDAANKETRINDVRLLHILLRGPVYVLTFGLVLAIAIFWYSNLTRGISKEVG